MTQFSSPEPVQTNVLLVEDEPPVRRLVQRILERNGYHVLSAEDGVAAWEISERTARPIDLVVTDVVMPRMDGVELADRFGSRLPHVPILFISGFMRNERMRNGALASNQAFLEKPFTPSAFIGAVEDLLGQQEPALNARGS